MYKSYPWNFKGKTGIGLDLQAVKVLDLVEYIPQEEFADTPTVGGVDIKEDF